MKKAVVDTSALVSIALSDLLRLVAEHVLLFVPPKVKEELIEMQKFKDLGGRAAKAALLLLGDGKISLLALQNSKRAIGLVDKNVDLGEAQCLVLAEEQGIATILMDDISAAYSLNSLAKAKGIQIKISAAAIIELWKAGKLNKQQCIQCLNKMIQSRKWEKGALEHLISKYLQNT